MPGHFDPRDELNFRVAPPAPADGRRLRLPSGQPRPLGSEPPPASGRPGTVACLMSGSFSSSIPPLMFCRVARIQATRIPRAGSKRATFSVAPSRGVATSTFQKKKKIQEISRQRGCEGGSHSARVLNTSTYGGVATRLGSGDFRPSLIALHRQVAAPISCLENRGQNSSWCLVRGGCERASTRARELVPFLTAENAENAEGHDMLGLACLPLWSLRSLWPFPGCNRDNAQSCWQRSNEETASSTLAGRMPPPQLEVELRFHVVKHPLAADPADSVPGVSTALQPPAALCDRCAIRRRR